MLSVLLLPRLHPTPETSVAYHVPRLADQYNSPFWVLISGVLLGLSFPPFPLYGLAWIALVPILIRWSRLPLGWMLLRETYSTFLVMAAIAGHWVLFHEQALTALTSGLGLLLVPIPMTLPFILSALVKRRFGTLVGFTSLVAMWLSMEFIMTHGPAALPWLLLGNTQAEAMLFNQVADMTGVGALTLWLWLVNGAVFWVMDARALPLRVGYGIALAALIAAPVVYGIWRLPQLEAPAGHVSVGIVQPAVAPKQWADVTSGERVNLLASLSNVMLLRAASERVHAELLLWPETSLPVYYDARRQRELYSRLDAWAADRDVALLTGAITRYDSAPALTVEPVVAKRYAQVTPYYNSALLFNAADQTQQYDKIHMIPFAERVPLVEWRVALAALGVASGGVGAYGLGQQETLFQVNEHRFGSLICYESLFGDHARRLAKQGAEFLVVLSQDGWWGESAGYKQHFALSRLRAVETRRTVIMNAVTGESGLVHSDGSVQSTAGWMEQSAEIVSVPTLHAQTYYTQHGDWVGRYGLFVSTVVLLAWLMVMLFFPDWRAPSLRPTQARQGHVPLSVRQTSVS